MTKKQTDFTVGSIPKHLLAFSWPMFLGNLLQTLYNTVDSIWVGRFLGPDALGAVSVGFPIIFALVSLVMGISMATTVMVSQFFGAKQDKLVQKTIQNSLLLLCAGGVIFSFIGVIFHRQLLQMINTPQELVADASAYLTIFLSGLIFMFLYNIFGAIMRGLGDSQTPLVYLAYATFLNIILDPIMIFGIGPVPKMGVAGAALATVISQALSAVLGLRYMFKNDLIGSWKGFQPDWEIIGKTFKIGLPAGIQQSVVSMGHIVVNSLINSFGRVVVAAFAAAAKLEGFAFMPIMSLSFAASAVAGQNLGADKPQRAHKTLYWSVVIVVAISLLVGFFLFLSPKLWLSVFTDDPNVLAEGSMYLRILAFSYIPFGVMFMINGLLRGAGDTLATMITSIFSLWLVRVPLAYYLARTVGLGSRGVWIAMATSPLSGLAFSYLYYRTGRWQRAVVTGKLQEDQG